MFYHEALISSAVNIGTTQGQPAPPYRAGVVEACASRQQLLHYVHVPQAHREQQRRLAVTLPRHVHVRPGVAAQVQIESNS
jgi:hypothetical protein